MGRVNVKRPTLCRSRPTPLASKVYCFGPASCPQIARGCSIHHGKLQVDWLSGSHDGFLRRLATPLLTKFSRSGAARVSNYALPATSRLGSMINLFVPDVAPVSTVAHLSQRYIRCGIAVLAEQGELFQFCTNAISLPNRGHMIQENSAGAKAAIWPSTSCAISTSTARLHPRTGPQGKTRLRAASASRGQ